jgi:hypothetical protein
VLASVRSLLRNPGDILLRRSPIMTWPMCLLVPVNSQCNFLCALTVLSARVLVQAGARRKEKRPVAITVRDACTGAAVSRVLVMRGSVLRAVRQMWHVSAWRMDSTRLMRVEGRRVLKRVRIVVPRPSRIVRVAAHMFICVLGNRPAQRYGVWQN